MSNSKPIGINLFPSALCPLPSAMTTSTYLPTTFANAIACVQQFALQVFDRQIAKKQLYYHNREHIQHVQQRSNRIFKAIAPFWENAIGTELTRMKLLLDLCVVAHDMLQMFVPQTQPHAPRRREGGVSEFATIDKLLRYIQAFNKRMQQQGVDATQFTASDVYLIREAIEGTICSYDPTDQAIYQPILYNANCTPSIVTRILLLADIGSLGMDGIAVYNREGSLLFLEENPDIIPFLSDRAIGKLRISNPNLYENLRQRLLRRAQFQVNFARSRLVRTPCEIEGLPADAISILIRDIFTYLTRETIQEIEQTTPVKKETTLEELLTFFQLEHYFNSLGLEEPSEKSD
jgi:hypothetical protein